MASSLAVLVTATLISLFVAWAIDAGSSGATPMAPAGSFTVFWLLG